MSGSPKSAVVCDTAAPAIARGPKRAAYWILRGTFGKATVSVQQRALVPHAHPYFQMLFKLGGEDIHVRTSKSLLTLSDSSMIVFNPWESHAVLRNPRGPSENLVLEIDQHWLAALIGMQPIAIHRLFEKCYEDVSPEISELTVRMAVAVCAGVTATEIKGAEAIKELVTAIVRNFARTVKLGNSSVARTTDSRIRRALQRIRALAPQNPNLEQIAAEVGLSRSHFFQQFKLCVGVSPQHFLDGQRISMAIDRLCTTDDTVSEIAHQLRFSAPSHFTRFFVQHIGLSPSEYRRSSVDGEAPAETEPNKI